MLYGRRLWAARSLLCVTAISAGVTSAVGIVAAITTAITTGCVATPQPDIPEDYQVTSVDPDQVRIDIANGHDRLLVTGLDGAADTNGTSVRVQNLSTGDTADVPIANNGSFSAEIQGGATQMLGLSQFVGEAQSPTIFVAGGARHDAVEVGDEEACEPLPEPTPEECLLCRFDGREEIRGCNLDDFVEAPAPNSANVAGCLFLSTEVLGIELVDPENFVGVGFVYVFNSCGEPVLFEIGDLVAAESHRFVIFPEVGSGPIMIDPTFFGLVEIFYNGADRAPDAPPDEASVVINILLPSDPDIDLPERLLGTIILEVFVPEL